MMHIPLFGVVNTPEMEKVTLEVLRGGTIASGQYISRFESSLGLLLGVQNVVTTVDMTSAMHLALYLSGVRSGDEVITTAYSCLSSNSSIAAMGATAVWVDVVSETIFMDPIKLSEAISPKTKAVILYHVAGYPGYIDQIVKVCKENNIFLIEDCNNSLLATYKDKFVGYWGDFSIYSFYPNRQINTTEGGALVCKNEIHAHTARKLRRFGIDFKTFRQDNGEINPESDIEEAGWAYTMNNLCAALGESQVAQVSIRIEKARLNALIYQDRLKNFTNIRLINPLKNTIPSYWSFLIYTTNKERLLPFLKSKGIQSSSLHQLNHQYTCFGSHVSKHFLPNIEMMQKQIVGIPCGWWLTETMIEKISDELLAFERNE